MVQTTHELRIEGDRVTKRYRRWDRGEPDREHAALSLLHRHAPGLGPEPLELDRGEPPTLTMTRVPGRALGAERLSPAQVAAYARALRRLHGAVPVAEATALGVRRSGPAELLEALRTWAEGLRAVTGGAGVDQVVDEARDWLAGPEADAMSGPLPEQVFSLADGNLGNVLWDGAECRFVDFEDAGLSDPAYEVADAVEHLTAWLDGLVPADLLVAEMGFTTEQKRRLGAYRRLLAVFWLLMLLPGSPGHARNPPGSLERQADRVRTLLLGHG